MPRANKRDWIEFIFVDHLVATVMTFSLLMAICFVVAVMSVASHTDEIGQDIGHFARQVSDGYHSNHSK